MSLDEFFVPIFAVGEPADGQRWSTWPAVIPSQRGPRPWPDWVVTSAAAFDTELGIVKTGKEADVFLIERAVPGEPSMSSILAAKRYRGPEHSDFHRSGQYTEGRRMRNTRDTRAVARRSAYGKAVSAGRWAHAEFEALCTMHGLGVPVPYPVQVNGTEILMEFVGDDITAAPRLAHVRATRAELADLFAQVVEILRLLARAGVAHGDFSAFNLLVHHGRVIVIDLPQLIEVASNPNGMALLHRDCLNVCDWFTRQGLERDTEALFADLVATLCG
ncbi:serine protein kinase RIO [Cryobacterium roopkundense]|uniref:non-specific serine/threonine protein kinase n=1 Tax=Cryobacterium roopkundense TaxID=1001240 RepID=A0A7W9A0A6_9MICO|nr:RIO1 family regulatory kinase/ATPase [Cryobacterium roopkundense]MBB5643185.1 RIO kinase 1 [Cryobacterium roopkundense]